MTRRHIGVDLLDNFIYLKKRIQKGRGNYKGVMRTSVLSCFTSSPAGGGGAPMPRPCIAFLYPRFCSDYFRRARFHVLIQTQEIQKSLQTQR